MCSVLYTIGVDFGTLSARAVLADCRDGRILASAECPYAHAVLSEQLPDGTALPPQWALQVPQDYLDALTQTVRAVMDKSGAAPEQVAAIAWDFTSCTVLPVTEDGTPLCQLPGCGSQPHAYAKLWKHHAAQRHAGRIESLAREMDEPFLSRYGGRVSSEWTYPKLLQILDEAPELADKTDIFLEAGDWLLWQLTGQLHRSGCAAGFKQFWAADGALPSEAYLTALDERFPALAHRALRGEIRAPWQSVGTLNAAWAQRLGLRQSTSVAAGIIDAHAAVVGSGVRRSGQALLIVGTSECQLLLDERPISVAGICGYAKDAIVPELYAYESGQPCVGDMFDWFVRRCVPEDYRAEAREQGLSIHQLLSDKAARLTPGESGLVALDWWNGQRTPFVDDDLSGAMFGLTLRTRPEEQYRALLESAAFGTRLIFDTYRRAGMEAQEFIACGGIAQKNPLLMQIYADVLRRPIRVSSSDQACALGAAILAAAAGGCHESLSAAMDAMAAQPERVYHPNSAHAALYDQLYDIYETLARHFAEKSDVMHRLLALRQGNDGQSEATITAPQAVADGYVATFEDLLPGGQNMKPIHIFDLDGTLVNSMPYFTRGILQVLEEEGISYEPDLIEVLTPLGYTKSAELYQTMGVPGTVEDIVGRIQRILHYEYANNITLKPGVNDYLRKLKAQGATLCVLTASPHLVTDVCLQRNGVYDLFDHVWSVEDYGLSKSETVIYDEVVRRLGCAREDICFYDDNLTAASTAVKAGWYTCAVNDDQPPEITAALKTAAHAYVASFEDLL